MDEDAGKWYTNTKEICKSAYSRISMLFKLKYVGVGTEDLLEIYSLFIRSRAEYLSVVWHSSLTLQQCQKIENIQKTSLKIILGENYTEMTAFEELSVRRQKRCLSFAKKSLNYPIGASMFPQNHHHDQNLRTREKYTVNFAHTESYKHSAVPYCQNLLNADARESAARDRARQAAAAGGRVDEEGVGGVMGNRNKG